MERNVFQVISLTARGMSCFFCNERIPCFLCIERMSCHVFFEVKNVVIFFIGRNVVFFFSYSEEYHVLFSCSEECMFSL